MVVFVAFGIKESEMESISGITIRGWIEVSNCQGRGHLVCDLLITECRAPSAVLKAET